MVRRENSNWPTPGMLNMFSRMIWPEMMPPICKPITVSTGIIAFLIVCRMTTLYSPKPFARAVRM